MVVYLPKTERSEGFHQIVDFLNTSHIKYALTKNPTIYVSLIQQFWQTVAANTLDTKEYKSLLIDGMVKLVSEISIRRNLMLEDSDDEAASTSVDARHGGAATTVTSLDARHGSDEAASTSVDARHGGAATTVTSLDAGHGSGNID
uniref:Xylulose kinase-1 n=1 Tax=Tanacetum cinerariifolium TaxID=118510 RepID=A0A699IKP2_TANCI|nr:xylulose kinase-1 [Tanacetum cinerariifolium]